MAIDNTLIHFNKQEDFEKKVDEIPKTSITFIKDAGTIYTHGEKYQSVRWSKLTLNVPEGYERFYVDETLFKTMDGHFFTKEE